VLALGVEDVKDAGRARGAGVAGEEAAGAEGVDGGDGVGAIRLRFWRRRSQYEVAEPRLIATGVRHDGRREEAATARSSQRWPWSHESKTSSTSAHVPSGG
jgi:hypothetical protein